MSFLIMTSQPVVRTDSLSHFLKTSTFTKNPSSYTAAATTPAKLSGIWSFSEGSENGELSWQDLPQFALSVSGNENVPVSVMLSLSNQSREHIGIYIFQSETSIPQQILYYKRSNVFQRVGFVRSSSVSQTIELSGGKEYILVPIVKRTGPAPLPAFSLTASTQTTAAITLQRLERTPFQHILGEWTRLTAAGSFAENMFDLNPQYKLQSTKRTKVSIFLSQRYAVFGAEDLEMGLYVFKFPRSRTVSRRSGFSQANLVASTDFDSKSEPMVQLELDPACSYYVVPCTKHKGHEAHFLLRVFCPDHFFLLQPHSEVYEGEWNSLTAGGAPPNSPRWPENPQFILSLPRCGRQTMKITLEREINDGSKRNNTEAPVTKKPNSPMRFFVLPVASANNPRTFITDNEIASSLSSTDPTMENQISQQFDLGSDLKPSHYVIMPCLGGANLLGKFKLHVQSLDPLGLFEFGPADAPNWQVSSKEGSWKIPTAGGSNQQPTWIFNQQYLLEFCEPGRYVISLAHEIASRPAIGMILARETASLGEPASMERIFTLQSREIGRAEFRHAGRVFREVEIRDDNPTRLILIPCTLKAGITGVFSISIYGPEKVNISCIDDEYQRISIDGVWKSNTLGGTLKFPSWRQNPHFNVRFKDISNFPNVDVAISLIADTSEQANSAAAGQASGLEVATYTFPCEDLHRQKLVVRDGDLSGYMPPKFTINSNVSFVRLNMAAHPNGYTIIAANRSPRVAKDTPFKLTVFVPIIKPSITMVPIFQRGASGWNELTVSGNWTQQENGGCADNTHTWPNNASLGIRVLEPNTKVVALMHKPVNLVAGMYFLQGSTTPPLKKRNIIKLSQFIYGNPEIPLEIDLPTPGQYAIVPCTYVAGETGQYSLSIYSDKPIKLEQAPHHRKSAARTNVVAEILSTERSYLADLQAATEKFLHPIQARKNAVGMTGAEISAIFANISALYEMHQQLLNELESTFVCDEPLIGLTFLKFAPLFKIYTDYILSYFSGLTVLEKCMQRRSVGDLINQLNNSFTNADPGHRLLRDLLITPVQRIPRYVMLLQQLGKLTDESHPDHDDIHEAAGTIEATLNEINANMRKFEGLRKVVELERCLVTRQKEPYPLVSATRFHLRDGPVKLIKGPGAGDVHERYIFLFNDLMLLTAKHKDRFIVEWYFQSNVALEVVQKNPAQLKFGPFVVQLPKATDLPLWLASFEHAPRLTVAVKDSGNKSAPCSPVKVRPPLDRMNNHMYTSAPVETRRNGRELFGSRPFRATKSMFDLWDTSDDESEERPAARQLAFTPESEQAPPPMPDDT